MLSTLLACVAASWHGVVSHVNGSRELGQVILSHRDEFTENWIRSVKSNSPQTKILLAQDFPSFGAVSEARGLASIVSA